MEKEKFAILVVDDSPNNLHLIVNILTYAGYKVQFTTSGALALEILKNNSNFDLILLDVEMPVMNGYELCKNIRTDSRLKDLPVIFLTAYGDMEKKLIGFEAGAQDFVTKPFEDEELLSRIKIHIELKINREKLKILNEKLNIKVEEKTRELENAFNELKRQDKMKSDFLVLITREIKAPLSGVVGTINLIKNQEHSATVKSLVDTLDISLTLLENFATKANLLTQLISHKYLAKKTAVNIKELIQYAIIEINEKTIEKNIELNIDKIRGSEVLSADRDLLYKSFLYIIENALEHSSNNSKIIIENQEYENKSVYSFTDFGPGFTQEVLISVFKPFQFINVRESQKLSMSLYIIKLIMEIHNGEININNNDDGGASVHLIFNS